ncbi:MAG: regulatory protein RecX [Clostridia bacterium]|nr:regulatory protein RecX [Clostridia bacterium]
MNKNKRKFTARETAAKLCSLGRQTRKTLREKLYSKKFPSSEIEGAVLAMAELGYIDEAEYARAYVSDSYRIKKHGRIRILSELKMRGIPDSLAEDALSAFDVDECEIIKEELNKRFKDREEKEKIYRYFVSWGFSLSDVRSCMNED